MAYWLVKTEPDAWSWDRQVKGGRTNWDGVRNHQAANNLKAMKKGDLAFFYHSGEQRQVVGVVRVAGEHRPDPKDATGKFVMVEMETVAPVKTPVTLAQIKAEPRLADMVLVKNSRLSVQPVNAAQWKLVCQMGGIKA
ncbi:MAG: EVE domain-containing protein [Alphaproteobacteria bacterium]|nr:EVE domain-containing protein [Alphaproteobacteria bacterium]